MRHACIWRGTAAYSRSMPLVLTIRDASQAGIPRHRPRRAFTLVELLIVLAIIATLIGLLAPALMGAKRRSVKTSELNSIKHVGHAWMMYANSNNDSALPGFLEVGVQKAGVPNVSRGWGVTYKYPDNTVIPLNTGNLTGPWTWRLLPYLSYNHPLIHAHLQERSQDVFTLRSEGKSVSDQPAFGYNALYIGGWWEMVAIDGVLNPRFKFYDHCDLNENGKRLSIPTGVAQIRRSDEMVTFCSASKLDKPGRYRRPADNAPGFHAVMPPTVGVEQRWKPAQGDEAGAMEILQPNTWAPIGRYTGAIAVLYADGHVDEQGYGGLFDMRKWINDADRRDFKHVQCPSQP